MIDESTKSRYTLCPKCSSTDTTCVDSRIHKQLGGRRRRYLCRSCTFRWSTLEVPFQLLEGLFKLQPIVNSMTHTLADLREVLHNVPLDKLGTDQMDAMVYATSKDEQQ